MLSHLNIEKLWILSPVTDYFHILFCIVWFDKNINKIAFVLDLLYGNMNIIHLRGPMNARIFEGEMIRMEN